EVCVTKEEGTNEDSESIAIRTLALRRLFRGQMPRPRPRSDQNERCQTNQCRANQAGQPPARPNSNQTLKRPPVDGPRTPRRGLVSYPQLRISSSLDFSGALVLCCKQLRKRARTATISRACH